MAVTTAQVLLADVGGTHLRLRQVGPGGELLAEVTEPVPGEEAPSLALLARQLGTVARAAGMALSGPGAPRRVVITSRTVPWAKVGQRAAGKLAALAPGARVTLVPDGVAAYLGCRGQQPGAVLSVGTGTIAVAVDQSGRAHRLDGWGPQLGDVGSGYQVGLAGLVSACRWADGRRGGSELLRDAAVAAFGPTGNLPAAVRPHRQLRNIARFSEAVVKAARAGDHVAGAILSQAATELAELAEDAAAVAGGGPGLPVFLTGGFVAAVPELAEGVRARSRLGTVRVTQGQAGLDGCYLIWRHGTPGPFGAWVSELNPGP